MRFLFGLPGLRLPADFAAVATRAAKRAHRAADAASRIDTPPAETLAHLDALSNELCAALDAFELARNVHPSAETAAAANAAYSQLGEHLHHFNTNDALHRASVRALDALRAPAAPSPSASPEDVRLADAMRAELEQHGAHLDEPARVRLRGLQSAAAGVAAEFAAGAARPGAARDGIWVPRESLVGWAMASHLKHEGSRILVPAKLEMLSDALRQCRCSSARRELYLARETLGQENLPVLERLLRVRSELASVSGHASYADYVSAADGRMECAPRRALERMRAVSIQLRPLADAESRALALDSGPSLEAWDAERAIALGRARATHGVGGEALNYFELGAVLGGLGSVLRAAFGVELRRAPAFEGELWDATVTKLHLCGGTSAEPVGVLYLDLFARAGKVGGAALYTLRAGELAGGSGRVSFDDLATESLPSSAIEELRLPAAALVCSFAMPRTAGSDEATGATLLSHGQVRTLYHEMGHALHALIARPRYQHFSGVRVAADFIEVPSILMERFCDDPRVLRQWAPSMPRDIADALCESQAVGAALECQDQLIASMLDLELHLDAGHAAPAESSALLATLREEHSSLGAPLGTHPHARFAHLGSYGASYYSYLWGRAIAGRVWREGFAADPLGGEGGRAWCASVLRYGGAKPPRKLLRDYFAWLERHGTGLGGTPQISPVDKALEVLVSGAELAAA